MLPCSTIAMENKEILMVGASLGAEWSLRSGNPCRAERPCSRPALCSLCSQQNAAVTTCVLARSGDKKKVLFSRSPGIAFPLPQHSWDAAEPTQGPHPAVQSPGPDPAAEAAWAGWASLCSGAGTGPGDCLVQPSTSPLLGRGFFQKDVAELFALN